MDRQQDREFPRRRGAVKAQICHDIGKYLRSIANRLKNLLDPATAPPHGAAQDATRIPAQKDIEKARMPFSRNADEKYSISDKGESSECSPMTSPDATTLAFSPPHSTDSE